MRAWNWALVAIGLVSAVGVSLCSAAEGDGLYSLRLHGMVPPAHRALTPLDVEIERRDGRFVAAIGSATLGTPLACTIDLKELTLEGGRLAGKLLVAFPPGVDNKGRATPAIALATVIDAAVKDGAVSGTHQGDARLLRLKSLDPQPVSGRVRPLTALPARYFMEAGLHWGHHEYAPVLLRVLVTDGNVAQALAYVQGGIRGPIRVPSDEGAEAAVAGVVVRAAGTALDGQAALGVSLADGRSQATFRFEGTRVGLRATGTLTVEPAGGRRIEGTFLARLVTGDVLPPVSLGSGPRTWKCDAEGERKLMAEALAESLVPIRPGEPGKQAFWNWHHVKKHGELRCIHPPAFEFVETAGAASYRYEVTHHSTGKLFTFTAEKPWRPFTAIWRGLPLGASTLKVVPLGPDGQPLAVPVRWRYYGRIDEGLPVQHEDNKAITIVKYPPFQGPYVRRPRPYRDAVLLAARAAREVPKLAGARRLQQVHETFAGGDHGVQREVPGALFAHSLLARLSTCQIERDEARRAAEDMGEAILLAMRRPVGVPHTYKDYIPINYRNLAGFLDLYRDTGDPRWARAAETLAANLIKLRTPAGTWAAIDAQGRPVRPGGVFRQETLEFDPSLILWQLGRLRHDLKTDRFRLAEREAHAYVMSNAARTMLWPEVGYHSLTQSYPHAVSGNCTIAFVRYLLDYAEPDARDLKLAEELLRWCEDRHIDWTRPAEVEPGGCIYPTSGWSWDGGRTAGQPGRMAIQQALGWLKLHRHTRRPLHLAKAEALADAVLTAQDPISGNINTALRAQHPSFAHFPDNDGETVRELDEFATLRETLVDMGRPGRSADGGLRHGAE